MNSKGFVSVTVIAVVIAGAVGWAGASRIKSPAQLAAETAAPKASLITVPVQKLTLSADVITRGSVRHRAPLNVNLASSALKSSTVGVVTLAPEIGTQLEEGKAALAVGGRPVFVLTGAVPAFRDLTIGTVGDDVRQLEEALTRLGFDPGPVDGTYDAATAAAVAAWYGKAGWTPFGPTEPQRQALAAARDNAAKTKQTQVQADFAVAQARFQLGTDRTTAVAAVGPAAAKVQARTTAISTTLRAVDIAKSTADRDEAQAIADAAGKVATARQADAAQRDALFRRQNPPTGSSIAEVAALQAALDRSIDLANTATAELAAAQTNVQTVQAMGVANMQRAQDDVTTAEQDIASAGADLARAQTAANLASTRVQSTPPELSLLEKAAMLAAQDGATADAEYQRLAAQSATQVPADELLFLPDLPRRVDEVKVKRGDPITANLMTVSGLSLSIDGALSASDAKLVTVGARVTIEEADLKITATGVVSVRAAQPGTKGVDPQKFYMEVTPDNAPASLVGASVKLTIPVKSTSGDVLAVPLSALTVGAGGSSRVEVVTGAATRFVDVVPGLAAQGLVEVTAPNGGLAAGDNVVVGRGNEKLIVPVGTQTTNPPAPDTTAATSNSSQNSGSTTTSAAGAGG